MGIGPVGARVLSVVLAALFLVSAFAVTAGPASAEPMESVSTVGTLPQTRVSAASFEYEGKIYIVGGFLSDYNGAQPSLDSVLIYDPQTDEVSRGAPMIHGTAISPHALGSDGLFYVFGGWNDTVGGGYTNWTQVYDPVDDSWALMSDAPFRMGGNPAVALQDGRIIVFGGYWGMNLNSTIAFTPSTDTWEYLADQPGLIWLRRAVSYSSTAIYVMGGRNESTSSETGQVDVYNPVDNTWDTVSPLLTETIAAGAAYARNGYIYYFGGTVGTWPGVGSEDSGVQRYDPVADEWSYAPVWLPTTLVFFTTCTDGYGRVFVAGGFDGTSVRADVVMITMSEVSPNSVRITSPTDGSIVSGVVEVTAAQSLVTIGASFVDFVVDGTVVETQVWTWPYSWSFIWDASALADGSTHTLLVRLYLMDGRVLEDSVTVTVTDKSVEQLVAEIQQQVAVLQAMLDIPGANLTSLAMEAAILQAKLDGIIAGMTAAGVASSAMWDQLNVTFAALQTQLDDFQEQIDRVENKADTAGTYGIVTMVLVIIIVILVALMVMMARKKP
jgi:N-acetylneuraminic acid mutarotase